MTPDERERLLEILLGRAELTRTPLTAAGLLDFTRAVNSLPFDRVVQALDALSITLKRFPLPADVHEYLHGTVSDRALHAWSRVERAMRVAGPYQSVTFAGDSVIPRVIVQLGGWPFVARSLELDERDYGFRRREFMQLYELFEKRGGGLNITHLPGIAENHNTLHEGGFERGIGHVDPVLEIDEAGAVRRELPPPPRPALPPSPEKPFP